MHVFPASYLGLSFSLFQQLILELSEEFRYRFEEIVATREVARTAAEVDRTAAEVDVAVILAGVVSEGGDGSGGGDELLFSVLGRSRFVEASSGQAGRSMV